MTTRTRPRSVMQPDPFVLDPSSEEFFAIGDRPTPVVEKIELDLEEEDTEIARRSAPEVVLRRRRYRRLVTRVVSGVSVLAIAALAKTALRPADASALRAMPGRTAQLALVAEPAPPTEVASAPSPTEEAEVIPTAPSPAVEAAAPPEPPAKVAHHAAKRDDDFADLDIKIDVPKIDTSLDL